MDRLRPRCSHEVRSARMLIVSWLTLLVLVSGVALAQPSTHVALAWNDLGMHCMNHWFHTIAVLPPYNNLVGQVILRGYGTIPPHVVTSGLTVEYSIPGNTYSTGKTDFWDYDVQLFGIDLPLNIGLTGKGLTGVLDPVSGHYIASGIPITPYPDATPTTADPYQQALVIVRDAGGTEVCRSVPVIPVSVEMNCVSSGCHASETAILGQHEQVPGFNPNNPPILCAGCHADPILGTTGIPEAGYFSLRMHAQHEFIDQEIPGIAGCYKCHPGPQTQCLRGAMNNDFGLICQDCHGTMGNMALTIEGGRIPWMQEPACRSCHTAPYGEPQGQLFRNSQGHGGVFCSGCHGSPHAEFPSRVARDNANAIALQGHAGILRDCRVCHGSTPSAPGPHGYVPTDVVESEIVATSAPLRIYPSPVVDGCTIEFAAAVTPDCGTPDSGRLLVFDSQGRTLRLLRPQLAGDGHWRVRWDACRADGRRVAPGIYFVRWDENDRSGAARLIVAR